MAPCMSDRGVAVTYELMSSSSAKLMCEVVSSLLDRGAPQDRKGVLTCAGVWLISIAGSWE